MQKKQGTAHILGGRQRYAHAGMYPEQNSSIVTLISCINSREARRIEVLQEVLHATFDQRPSSLPN